MISREAKEISISAVRNKQFIYTISYFIIFILFTYIVKLMFMETVPPQRKHTLVRLNDT